MRWFDRLEEWLIALLLGTMTGITFVQVIARYAFNYSFVWALELVTILFAWLIFLGMAYGVRVHAHIGVDAAVKALRPGTARVVATVATLLCIVYAVIFLVGSYVYVAKMYEVGIELQDIPAPQWIPRLVLPIGFGLLLLRFLQVLWNVVTGRETRLLGDEAEDALKHRTDAEPEAGGR